MIINVYKETNMTSFDVIKIIRKHFKTKKVGHTGTLDPIATGVLICCLDSSTKLVSILQSQTKEYIAEIKLGIKTDTGDITGNIIDTKDFNLNEDLINKVLTSFIGKYLQEVPLYSAVKVNGKKLYKYGRSNEQVTLPKRNVSIYAINLISYKGDLIKFKVTVSKGTYIRSLINDICEKLNTVGTMSSLCRTKQGIFEIKDANKIDDILNDNYKTISYDEIFNSYYQVNLNDEEYFKVINGQRMPNIYNHDEVIFMYQGKYIALYEDVDNTLKIKIMLNNNNF